MTLAGLGGMVVETARMAPSTISTLRLRSTDPSATSTTCALVSHPAPLSGIVTHNANISQLPPPLRRDTGAEMSPRSRLAD
jgi:alpha/beta superfamily hydrolase